MSLSALRTVVVCGSRKGIAFRIGEDAMRAALARWRFEHVVVGSLQGCDLMAHDWACRRGAVACTVVPADWTAHGKSAGPIRNRRMLTIAEPVVVLAFPGGRGTEDCVQAAHQMSIPVSRWLDGGWR